MRNLALVFVAASSLITGCGTSQNAASGKLPVISAAELIGNPTAFYQKPVRLYGEVTAANPKEGIWIVNKRIQIFTTDIDLVKGLKPGDKVLVRGYFGKGKSYEVPYALYSAY